jgi:hypothetical protein
MMGGYKTWIGGVGFMCVGVYQLFEGNAEAAAGSFAMGMSIIGIGHKVEKSGK